MRRHPTKPGWSLPVEQEVLLGTHLVVVDGVVNELKIRPGFVELQFVIVHAHDLSSGAEVPALSREEAVFLRS